MLHGVFGLPERALQMLHGVFGKRRGAVQGVQRRFGEGFSGLHVVQAWGGVIFGASLDVRPGLPLSPDMSRQPQP